MGLGLAEDLTVSGGEVSAVLKQFRDRIATVPELQEVVPSTFDCIYPLVCQTYPEDCLLPFLPVITLAQTAITSIFSDSTILQDVQMQPP